jgi:hypothetical protein
MVQRNCYGHNLRLLNLFCNWNRRNNTDMNTTTPSRRELSATTSGRTARRAEGLGTGTAGVIQRALPQNARDVIRLAPGGLWSRVPAQTGLRVTCAVGDLWITQAGGEGDAIVRAGASFVTASRGKVVVQAIDGAASFTFDDRA